MSALSKQAETKLIGAIEAAAALVNTGMTPNAAIIKSATDAGIPPGHIDLMVHAYNTGRTTKQREQGENTLEKAADFALASIDDIKSELFSQHVKTSAQIVNQQVVSTEYATSPYSIIKSAQRLRSTQEYHFSPTFVAPPRDAHAQAEREYSQKRAAHWDREERRRRVYAAFSKTAAKFDELVTYFRTPGHVPFADVVNDVKLVHGDDGVKVMQKLANLNPTLEKEAAKNLRVMTDTTARNLVGEVLEQLDAYNKLANEYDKKKETTTPTVKKAEPEIVTGSILVQEENVPLTLKNAAIQGLDKIHVGGGRYQPVIEEPGYVADISGKELGLPPGLRPVGKIEEPSPPSKLNNNKPNAGNSGGGSKPIFGGPTFSKPVQAVGYLMGMGGDKGDKNDTTIPGKAEFNAISDPEQDETIKNIRAKSVLHDLILNDPVISGHDPQDVAMAFNDIAELAPNLVDTPGMLQTVLRKRLEAGQLADFDVKQILEMDKLRAERDKIQGEARRINMETM